MGEKMFANIKIILNKDAILSTNQGTTTLIYM